MALRVSTATDDAQALYRIGWTVRRLTGRAAPLTLRSDVGDLETFLERRDRPEQGERFDGVKAPSRVLAMAKREAFVDRAAGWLAMMDQAEDLHPMTCACMGFHLWHVAELSPIAMGGGWGFRAIGDPPARLARWLNAMESAPSQPFVWSKTAEDILKREHRALDQIRGNRQQMSDSEH